MSRDFAPNLSVATDAAAAPRIAIERTLPATIRRGLAVAATAFVFASTATAFAESAPKFNACTGAGVHNAAIVRDADGTVQIARLPWPAPVGHRQPNASEVAGDEFSAAERDHWLDTELDRKLVICHGC